MNPISPYDEALRIIKQHPGTSGASGLAKLVLSLYNEMCGFSIRECVSSLDQRLTSVALRLVDDYVKHGETDDLRAAGKIIADDLYPGLWEMSLAMSNARDATRAKWEAAERKSELDALNAAEVALFTNLAKLIPPGTAKELLEKDDPLYAYYNVAGEWRDAKLIRDTVHAAIDLAGGAELSCNCPESSLMLAVRIDHRIYYVCTDYDAREAYLDTIEKQRRPIPRKLSVPRKGQL